MRVLLLMAPELCLSGCAPTLAGWWDLDRWEVSGAGDPVVRDGAGFAVWAKDSADFDLVLRYAWDPAAGDLVPLAEPPLYESSFDQDEFDVAEPLVLSYGTDDTYYTVSFEIVKYRSTRMELTAPSPVGDPTTWTWTLLR